MKNTTVYYYIKGEPKQTATFMSYAQAISFLKAMKLNPQCESCGIERERGE